MMMLKSEKASPRKDRGIKFDILLLFALKMILAGYEHYIMTS